MRRLILVLAAVSAAAVLAACGGDDDDGTGPAGPALDPRTVDAGEVTVKITPVRVDADGAEFDLTFDTHTVDLGLDVARAARFSVAGRTWTGATWEGAAPGGHHREGTLRFRAAGQPSGTARLAIGGLPEPVVATWRLGGA